MFWFVLEECKEIALERQKQYGNYEDNFKIFETHVTENKNQAVQDGILSLIWIKLGRWSTNIKNGKDISEDTILDLINYLAMYLDFKRKNKK